MPTSPSVEALELVEEVAPYLLYVEPEVIEKAGETHVYSDIRNDSSSDNNDGNGRSSLEGVSIDTTQSKDDWTTYQASAYTAKCDGCSGITKTGVDVRNTIHHEGIRIIAVDPARIALGSAVEVRLGDGTTFHASAQDVGGAIKGARVDVLHADKESAYRFGRQDVEIRILQ